MLRPSSPSARGSLPAVALTVALLAVPAVVLGVAAYRTGSAVLAIGAVAELLGAALLVRARGAWRPPTAYVLICLYLMGLGLLWFATRTSADAFAHAAQGLLILMAVGLLAVADLTRSGVEPRRRARRLTHRLLARTRWPLDVDGYARLPEVAALARVVRDDPALVFDLLDDPRAEVRTAALTALQDRPHWRWEEAAVVLAAGHAAASAEVRELAVRALASADQVDAVIGVGGFLRDQAAGVRQAAVEALLAGGERRWAVVRNAVRGVLSDTGLANDGPLPGAAGQLPAIAVCDLTGWAAEPPPLGERAVRTLLAHYNAVARTNQDPSLPAELGRQMTDANTPQVLRSELAGLLRDLNHLPPALLDRMTDADQPGPVRLLAVEVLLAADPGEASAVDVLRGLGRQSNRETALAIARILQQCLLVDMGLPPKGVPLNSRQAAEVSRRVLLWATGKSASATGLTDTPGPRGGDHTPAGAADADDEDALGGAPPPAFPASAPGLSPPRLKRGKL